MRGIVPVVLGCLLSCYSQAADLTGVWQGKRVVDISARVKMVQDNMKTLSPQHAAQAKGYISTLESQKWGLEGGPGITLEFKKGGVLLVAQQQQSKAEVVKAKWVLKGDTVTITGLEKTRGLDMLKVGKLSKKGVLSFDMTYRVPGRSVSMIQTLVCKRA